MEILGLEKQHFSEREMMQFRGISNFQPSVHHMLSSYREHLKIAYQSSGETSSQVDKDRYLHSCIPFHSLIAKFNTLPHVLVQQHTQKVVARFFVHKHNLSSPLACK